MSFAFLPLYTGDYRRDTQHLTPLRHGIYLLLLMHCWDTKGPAPHDEQELAGIANCRSSDEIDALRYILTRFFVRMDDGHYNTRMQREVERAENISGARASAGRKGYEARAQAIAKQVLSNCQASASTPTPTPTPTTTTTATKPKGEAATPPDLVPAELWQAFRKTRQALKAPLTPQAEVLLVAKLRRLQAAGEDAIKVVEQSVERGWKGFFPVDGGRRSDSRADRRAAVNAAIWGKSKEAKDDDAIDGTAERVA